MVVHVLWVLSEGVVVRGRNNTSSIMDCHSLLSQPHLFTNPPAVSTDASAVYLEKSSNRPCPTCCTFHAETGGLLADHSRGHGVVWAMGIVPWGG